MVIQLISALVLLATPSASPLPSDSPWNHYVYAQTWPVSFCMSGDETQQCEIPENVTTWINHGLWPTQNADMGPSFCDDTKKFNMTAVLPIYGVLVKYWTNLITSEPNGYLWKHEWEKHGTCSEDQPMVNSELKYFQMGLELNRIFNITALLEKANINPSNETKHQYDDIVQALNADGANYSIQCYYDKEKKVQHFAQVTLCLDKTFKPTPCPANSSPGASPRRLGQASLRHRSNNVQQGVIHMGQDIATYDKKAHSEILFSNHQFLNDCWTNEPILLPSFRVQN